MVRRVNQVFGDSARLFQRLFDLSSGGKTRCKAVCAMYSPVKDGIEKTVVDVLRHEPKPSSDLSSFVDCFWELKSVVPLEKDFVLHAIPDACVNIMFNEIDIDIAGVTALNTSFVTLNLGREFHYVGIQFLPGVWQGDRKSIKNDFVGDAYDGPLPLIEKNKRMAGLSFEEKQAILEEFVRELVGAGIVVENPICAALLKNVTCIRSVADMAQIAGISTRQLQRCLRQWTGFSPHDFLKVLRLQQAMKLGFPILFADQSHFIHAFQAMTGYTPGRFFRKFNV